MCHCIAEYYVMCHHLDPSLTTVNHCAKAMTENYDCHTMKEWFLPRHGTCHLCKYVQKQQRKCRRQKKHMEVVAPQPEDIVADANEDEDKDEDVDGDSHGRDVDDESDDDLEIPSLRPSLAMDGSNELQSTVQLCPTPPSTSPDSSLWDRPIPHQPMSKRRTWSSSIPVPMKPTRAPARRSLIPLPTDKSRRQSCLAGSSQEHLDDLRVFDQVTF